MLGSSHQVPMKQFANMLAPPVRHRTHKTPYKEYRLRSHTSPIQQPHHPKHHHRNCAEAPCRCKFHATTIITPSQIREPWHFREGSRNAIPHALFGPSSYISLRVWRLISVRSACLISTNIRFAGSIYRYSTKRMPQKEQRSGL